MAKADTSVSHFNWKQAGAPQVAGVAGNLVQMLDAVLVNGFGLSTVDSAVIAGNACTLTISAGHSQIVDGVCEIAGVTTPAVLNGKWKVKAATATTVVFDMDVIADQTATGTITLKVASLGWQKPFSAANIGVYRSPNVLGTGHYLRVDDTAAWEPRVFGYEAMTDVNTGTGQFPGAGSVPGGYYWAKSQVAGATTRPWAVFGDDRLFFYWLCPTGSASNVAPASAETMCFGDPIPLMSTDSYYSLLQGGTSAGIVSQSNGAFKSVANSGNSGLAFSSPRDFTGIGGPVFQEVRADYHSGILSGAVSGGSSMGAFPTLDGRIPLSRVHAYAGSISSLVAQRRRSVIPGAYVTDVACASTLSSFYDLPTPDGPLLGRRLVSMRHDNSASTTPGVIFFDVTGPWR